jgi:hypothetical protein
MSVCKKGLRHTDKSSHEKTIHDDDDDVSMRYKPERVYVQFLA